MFERKPILEGKTDVDQCVRIFQLVGSPNDTTMPGWSDLPGCEGQKSWEPSTGDIDRRFGKRLGPEGLDLLKRLLCLDWRTRVNAIDALQHEYFKVTPLPARPEDLPRYEDSHELDSRRRGHEKQRALPPAPAGGTVGMGPDEWNPNGPAYQNGHGYGDRRGYGRDSRERGPAQPAQRAYEDRRSRPGTMDNSRQPAWRSDRDSRPLPPVNGHHLPPRPSDLPSLPDNRTRGPPTRPPVGGDRIDTYIPSYSQDRPPPRDFDRSRRTPPRDGDRGHRDPDAPPVVRDRDRDRDRYRGPDNSFRGERQGYRENEPRRTRSRSPDRDRPRDQRENDGARRERLQNRERDLYRR